MLKPATFHYNRPISQEEQKRVIINLYESGIAEEFIAMQLDLEIPTVISILKENNIYKGGNPNNNGWTNKKHLKWVRRYLSKINNLYGYIINVIWPTNELVP